MRARAGGLRRGFLHRAAGAFFLCALLGLLLVIPSVSSDTDAAKPAESAEFANIPLYSDWRGEGADDSSDLLLDELLADDGGIALSPEELNVGSFSLHRPQSELFINGLIGELYGITAGAALESDDVEAYLQARARARLTGEAVLDFKTWLTGRGEGISDRILLGSADYVSNYLTAAATDGAAGLRFVRTVEWDYQSSLGERRWQSGLSALGALREGADDVVAWQLRGYAAEDSGVGANAGLIYRRAAGAADSALWGVNAFLDYEKHGDYDEDFLRWSLGGEYRNAYLDIYLNRYFPITDGARQADGNYVYTQGGQEAYINLKAPDFGIGQVSGGLTYYLWEGEYGDADDKGFRYHIGFAPQRGNLRLELELDSPDGGSTDWGGRVSYRHIIGGADKGTASAGAVEFDARSHFFDVVRREYAQRIRESGAGARVVVAALLDNPAITTERAELDIFAAASATDPATEVALTVAGETYTLSLSQTVSITVLVDSTLALTASNWSVTVYKESGVRLLESGSLLDIHSGTIFFDRNGNGLNNIHAGPTRISLLGTRGEVGVNAPTAVHDAFIHLMEGTIALTITSATEIDLDIVELQATAMVELATSFFDPTLNITEPMQLTVGCATPEQRENHRIVRADFAGCVDDVRVSLSAVGQSVTVHAQGMTLTLVGVDVGGSILVSVDNAADAAVTLTAVWAAYPFHPHTATLNVAGGAVLLSHVQVTESDTATTTLTATLTVATDSTVAFAYVDAEQAADSAAAVSIYAAILNDSGAISGIAETDEQGAVQNQTVMVDCAANQAAKSEGLVSIVAVCGDAAVASADSRVNADGILELFGRINIPQEVEITLSGGGRDYDFSLAGADATLSLQNDNGAVATLTLFALTATFEDRRYTLNAVPRAPFDAFAASAQIPILLDNLEKIVVLNDGAVVATFPTELVSNTVFYTVSHVPNSNNTPGEVSYEYITPSPDQHSALRGNFSLIVNAGVTTNMATMVTAVAEPTEFPLMVRVIDDHTDNDALDTDQIATFTVVLAHPGAVTSTPAYVSGVRDPNNNDYRVFGLVGDTDAATFSDTGNALVGGVSLSGISVGTAGTYKYSLIAPAGETPPAGFVLVTSGTNGVVGGLQLNSSALPTAGNYELTVSIDDDHSESAPFVTVVSLALAAPLAAGATQYDAQTLTLADASAGQVVATITLSDGFGTRSFTIQSVMSDSDENADDLFSVAPGTGANAGMGLITFTNPNDGVTHDTGPVTVIVKSMDMAGGMQLYTMSATVLAPLAVAGNVPRQFVGDNLNSGDDFYALPIPSDDFVRGGIPPYTYALVADSVIDGDDFGIVFLPPGPIDAEVNGQLGIGEAVTPGQLATVLITVSDSSSPVQATSFMVTVEAIDGGIVFDPASPHELNVPYNAAEGDGVISVVQPAWSASPGYGAFSYRLAEIPSSPLIAPYEDLLSDLTIDSAGELSLTEAVDAGSAVVQVLVNAAADGYDAGEVTARSGRLTLNLNFHAQVDFVDPPSRIERQISEVGVGTVLTTFAASGGSGDTAVGGDGTQYRFSIAGTPAMSLVALDANSGALTQTAAVNAAQTLLLTVRVTDETPALGGSRDAVIAIEWTVLPPIEYDASLARVLVIGGSTSDGNSPSVRSNEVWGSGDGKDWTLRTTHTGTTPEEKVANAATDKRFPARHWHAAVAHRGTVYVSGGGDNPLGHPPATFDDVWSSADGKDWTLVSEGQIPRIGGHSMLARGRDLFIVGGSDGGGSFNYDVWRSGDGGQTWSTLNIQSRHGTPPLLFVSGVGPNGIGDNFLAEGNAVALFHRGSLVVINGDPAGGKAVALDETVTPHEWKELGTTQAAVFGASNFARVAAFVFKGSIHLSRGEEMLSSADGETWMVMRNRATYGTNAGSGVAGSQIGGHAVVSVRADRAIITGGQFAATDGAGRTSRVWASANGKSGWSELKAPAEFGNLSYHAMVLLRRESLMLSGPESSEAAPLESRLPHAAGGELFRLTARGGSGARTFDIASTNPPSLSDAVEVSNNGVVTQKAVVDSEVLGTVTFRVADDNIANLSDTFEAVIRLQPLVVSQGEQRVLLIGGQTGDQDYRERPTIDRNPDGSLAVGKLISKATTNDIYASEDGINWVELKRASSKSSHIFTERAGHAAVVLNGTVYVSGGRTAFTRFDGVTRSDEVWASTDGAHWTLRSSGAFPARSNHQMLASGDGTNNTLFIVGGLGGTTTDKMILNDVWRSTDGGGTWTEFDFPESSGLDHSRKNFLAYVRANGHLEILGGRGNATDYVVTVGGVGNGRVIARRALSDELSAGIQPHGRNADGSKNDLTNDQRLNYIAADSIPDDTFGPDNDEVGMRILGRNNVWQFYWREGSRTINKINTDPAYKCFSDIGTVGHKAARLSSGGSNKLLAIGGLDIERPAAGGVYNDVWSSTDDGATWQLSQRFPPFSPRYDQAVVTYAPLESESVPALGSASPAKLQLKRLCGGTQAVHNDSLDNGDKLFTVTAGGGSGTYSSYDIVSVTPDDVPLRAGHLAVVEESGEQVVQIISRPPSVADTEELFVRVRVTDDAGDKATVAVEVSLLPQSGLNLEGPFVPFLDAPIINIAPNGVLATRTITIEYPNALYPSADARTVTTVIPAVGSSRVDDGSVNNLDRAARLKMQGRIARIERLLRDGETLLDDPNDYIEEVGPTEVGTELFRVRTNGGSGEYSKYSYSIAGVHHTPESGDPVLGTSHFGIEAVGIGEPSVDRFRRTGTLPKYPALLASVSKDTGVTTFIDHPKANQEIPREIVAFHDGFVGAFGKISQAALVDKRATVTLTVEVSDGGNSNEKSILTVEVELFPSQPLELLGYHAPPSNEPLSPHLLIPRRPLDCLLERSNQCPAYQPAIQISDLPQQFYYRYAGSGEITVSTPEVGGELFRVGVGGIEKSDGGYDFSTVAVVFVKDGQANPVSDSGLIELVEVADEDKFIGEDNSNLHIVRLKKVLPAKLANENERLSVHLRVTNGDATVNLTMTVHLRLPPALSGFLVIGGKQSHDSANNTRYNDVLFWNSGLEGDLGWSGLSGGRRFSERSGHAGAALGRSVYISGGTTTGTDRLDDVWVSKDDGRNWDKLDADSNTQRFPGRYYHKMLALDTDNDGNDDTLFVIGGISSGSTILNDVWTSTDGKNWTLSEAALDNDRQSFMAFVYDDDDDGPNPPRLLVAGGVNIDSTDAEATTRNARAFRAFNFNVTPATGTDAAVDAADSWDTLDDSDIPALPNSLYVTVLVDTNADGTPDALDADDPNSAQGAALDPHNNLPYLGAVGVAYNSSIFIYARNHIWHTKKGTTWTRASTQAPYGYFYTGIRSEMSANDRRVGMQPAPIDFSIDDDGNGRIFLTGGVTHDAASTLLDAGSASWLSIDGSSDWGNGPSIRGDVLSNIPGAVNEFRRIGHAVVVIKP